MPLQIHTISIFPGFFECLQYGVVGRSVRSGLVNLDHRDLRHYSGDERGTVDDVPYGGGPGMVMKPDVWGRALDDTPSEAAICVPSASGQQFSQTIAADLAAEPSLVFACGRYEGIDQRVVDYYRATRPVYELCLGPYVLPGGESAAVAMIEAVTRLLPGVLGNPESIRDDSFSPARQQEQVLEGPLYTRPPEWRGLAVPAVLLSGDHAKVAQWRATQSSQITARRRN